MEMDFKEILKKIVGGFFGGLLGAWGGAKGTNKLWRRLGLPILITTIVLLVLKSWLVLSIFSLMIVLSLGYGIPDNFPGGDKGSPLGRIYYFLFGRNYFLADIFTRGTIGLLSCLTFLSIPLLKSNWIMYIVGALITIVIYATFSWRTLGSVVIFGKNLIWSEILTYFALTTFAMFLIF